MVDHKPHCTNRKAIIRPFLSALEMAELQKIQVPTCQPRAALFSTVYHRRHFMSDPVVIFSSLVVLNSVAYMSYNLSCRYQYTFCLLLHKCLK